jgi:hypothetical protein
MRKRPVLRATSLSTDDVAIPIDDACGRLIARHPQQVRDHVAVHRPESLSTCHDRRSHIEGAVRCTELCVEQSCKHQGCDIRDLPLRADHGVDPGDLQRARKSARLVEIEARISDGGLAGAQERERTAREAVVE